MKHSVPVKIYYRDQIRRFNVDISSSFGLFMETIQKILSISDFSVKYLDDENDKIKFTTDDELSYALGSFFEKKNIFKVYVFNSDDVESFNVVKKDDEKKVEDDDRVRYKKNGKKRRIKEYDCRFVSHVTIDDGSKIRPNENFVKTWRLRNTGMLKWPKGTRLLRVSFRDDFKCASEVIVNECESECEVEVSVPMVAPSELGLYESFWKVALPIGKKFGQRIRCQVLVN